MARWLVALQGDKFDLEDLPRWFPDGEAYATSEGDSYFLVGRRFESLEDPALVRELAATVLDEFCAIAMLVSRGFKPPKLGAVLRENDDGSRVAHAFAVGADLEIRTKLRATLSGTVGPTQAQVLLRGVQADPALRAAVLLWADPVRTWPRLYRVLEETEMYLATTVSKAGLCSENERERFTRSANSAEVAGKDARHGGGKFQPPSKPMSLHEATGFISRMLSAALERASGASAA